MSERIEFRLSGSGGQGLITAGIILAKAAIDDGKYAIQSQSYGPEARGGASKAEVVISDSVIDHPKATTPKFVLCLTNEAYKKYGSTADESAVVLVDSSLDTGGRKNVLTAPILETALEEFSPIVANAIALGFVAGCTNVVSKEKLEDALIRSVPKGTGDQNARALARGYEFAATASLPA